MNKFLNINNFNELVSKYPVHIYFVGTTNPPIIKFYFHGNKNEYIINYTHSISQDPKKFENKYIINYVYNIFKKTVDIEYELMSALYNFTYLKTFIYTTNKTFNFYKFPYSLREFYFTQTIKDPEMYNKLVSIYYTYKNLDIHISTCEHKIDEFINFNVILYQHNMKICKLCTNNAKITSA